MKDPPGLAGLEKRLFGGCDGKWGLKRRRLPFFLNRSRCGGMRAKQMQGVQDLKGEDLDSLHDHPQGASWRYNPPHAFGVLEESLPVETHPPNLMRPIPPKENASARPESPAQPLLDRSCRN